MLNILVGWKKSEILPGVEEFVNKLRENNIKIAIASASKNTRTILERLGLEKKNLML